MHKIGRTYNPDQSDFWNFDNGTMEREFCRKSQNSSGSDRLKTDSNTASEGVEDFELSDNEKIGPDEDGRSPPLEGVVFKQPHLRKQ